MSINLLIIVIIIIIIIMIIVIIKTIFIYLTSKIYNGVTSKKMLLKFDEKCWCELLNVSNISYKP